MRFKLMRADAKRTILTKWLNKTRCYCVHLLTIRRLEYRRLEYSRLEYRRLDDYSKTIGRLDD